MLPFLPDGRFAPPALPSICAPRAELMAAFDSTSRSGFVYVYAPAGSGKSVSAALWLQQNALPSAWISLDAYDSSPAVFYRQFSCALHSLQPDNAMLGAVLGAEDFALSPVEHTIELAATMQPENTPRALVLDDLHLINSEEILRSLPLVLKRLPGNLITVVLSRHEPPDAWAALAQKSTMLTRGHLLFSKEEITEYFARINCPNAANASRLTLAATEGWAMGVQAVAQSAASGEPFDANNSSQLLSRYFETHIWDNWSTREKSFCLHTSIVNELTVDLAAVLSQQEDAAALLEQLAAANSFISKLDTRRYRYHPLFLEFLRQRAAAVPPATLKALHKRAARYYREIGDYPRALSAQIQSGAYKKLDTLLYEILFGKHKEIIAEHAEVLRTVFEQDLPQAAFSASPALYALSAWYYYLTGCPARFEANLDAMYNNLPLIALKGRKFVEFAIAAYSTDYRTGILAKVEQFGHYQPYTRLFTKNGIGESVVSITHNMPYLHRSNIDFSEIATDSNALDKLETTFAVLLGREWVYLRPTLAAGIFYERNQLDRALEQALEAERLFEREGRRLEGLICILVLKHSILWRGAGAPSASTHSTEASEVLAHLDTVVREQAQFFLPNFAAYKARLALYDGDAEAARAWVESYYMSESEQVGMLTAYRHFTTARAWMVLGQTKKAAACIETLKAFGAHYRRPLDLCEALLLEAVLLEALEKRSEATAALEQALQLLASFKNNNEAFGFMRIVADEGAAVLPLLKRVIKNNAAQQTFDASFLNEMLLAAHSFAKTHKGVAIHIKKPRAAGKNGAIVKLSKRQTQILELRAQGLNNTQASAASGLAIPTIKTHLFYAYRKLEVDNAMDAVLRARELGLLPPAHGSSAGKS